MSSPEDHNEVIGVFLIKRVLERTPDKSKLKPQVYFQASFVSRSLSSLNDSRWVFIVLTKDEPPSFVRRQTEPV